MNTERPARFPGVCPIPFEPTFVRLPGDAGRIARLEGEARVLILVNRALEGEVIAEREENTRLVAMLGALRERLADEERAREASLARLAARRRPSRLAAWFGALCLFVDAVWSQDQTRRAA